MSMIPHYNSLCRGYQELQVTMVPIRPRPIIRTHHGGHHHKKREELYFLILKITIHFAVKTNYLNNRVFEPFACRPASDSNSSRGLTCINLNLLYNAFPTANGVQRKRRKRQRKGARARKQSRRHSCTGGRGLEPPATPQTTARLRQLQRRPRTRAWKL